MKNNQWDIEFKRAFIHGKFNDKFYLFSKEYPPKKIRDIIRKLRETDKLKVIQHRTNYKLTKEI